MSYSGSGNTGGAWRSDGGVPPHAFDPWTQPELFRGVLTRRFFAFLIDLVVLSIPVILAVVFIAVFGIVTLGLGWALFWLVSPASVVWALRRARNSCATIVGTQAAASSPSIGGQVPSRIPA